MALTQLIYSSQPFGYDAAMLSNILLDARRCNARDAVTGALVCRRDTYLQFLEGEADIVHATAARIKADDRHTNMVVHLDAPASVRLFADWDMLHDPAYSWTWSEAEVADGALERASAQDFLDVFGAISRRQAGARTGD